MSSGTDFAEVDTEILHDDTHLPAIVESIDQKPKPGAADTTTAQQTEVEVSPTKPFTSLPVAISNVDVSNDTATTTPNINNETATTTPNTATTTPKPLHMCNICGITFSVATTLQAHMKTHTSEPRQNCRLAKLFTIFKGRNIFGYKHLFLELLVLSRN